MKKILSLLALVVLVSILALGANAATINVVNLEPDYYAVGVGGVFSGYYGPSPDPDYNYTAVSPGMTAVYNGRQAGIIKAGLLPDPSDGHYWDEGLFGFKPTVTIDTLAAEPLTYDVDTQYGENPVWMTIEIDTGVVGDRSDNTAYQFVPTTNPAGWHTVDAGAGLWQKWNDDYGNVTGNPKISLSQVAIDNTGLNVVRAYLRLGMGNSYHGAAGLGTVAWVDKVTLGADTYYFRVHVTTQPATGITLSDATLNGINEGAAAAGHSFWASPSTFSTTSPVIPAGVYSTPDLGPIAKDTAFSASLTSTGIPSVTPGTTYYFAAWSEVDGIWYPGEILSFTTPDTTPPTLTITGATANGADMPGDLSTGYILNTQRIPSKENLIQFKSGTAADEPLAPEYFGLKLVSSTVSPADLKSYYVSRGVPEPYLSYLNGAADGINPFVFINGATVKLVDGARHTAGAPDSDMAVPDDYPLGTYIVEGKIKDLVGNEKTITLKIIVAMNTCPAGTAKVLIQTIAIPSNDHLGAAGPVLQAGTDYLLEARGTWQNGGVNSADAEYITTDGWLTNANGYDIPPYLLGEGAMDLQVNDAFVNWQTYNPAHIYTLGYSGDSSAVRFRIFEGDSNTGTLEPSWYGDNSGSLAVALYKCQDTSVDTDSDGIYDYLDNCPLIYNPSQNDYDHNGIGDACGRWACPAGTTPSHLETLSVPATTLADTVSATLLNSSRLYLVTASGIANAGDNIDFDAEYSFHSGVSTVWTDYVAGYASYGTNLLDLLINGNAVEWGAYDPGHTYPYLVHDTSGTLGFHVNEIAGSEGNNAGFLRVNISECRINVDADGDGYFNYNDCNDSNPAIHPGAEEVCNGIDDNCDGIIDPEGSVGAIRYFYDGDGDGYGLDNDSRLLCAVEGYYTTDDNGDCDDSNPLVHPFAAEVCDGIDDNCIGGIDEGCLPNDAVCIGTDMPDNIGIGANYTLHITMLNNGTNSWSFQLPDNYEVISQTDPRTFWGGYYANITGGAIVGPGQQYTFTIPITAPSDAGTYTQDWQMLQEMVGFFGQRCLKTVNVVPPYGAQCIGDTLPASIFPGQSKTVNVTMKNTGSLTWTRANLYRLGIFNPLDSSIWGLTRVELPNGNTITPGQQHTFSFNIFANTTIANTYASDWKMVQNTTWFGGTCNNTIIIRAGTTLTTNPPLHNGWVNQTPMITLTSDSNSTIKYCREYCEFRQGVEYCVYCSNPDLFSTYAEPFLGKDGINTYHYYSIDTFGSIEPTKSTTIGVESSAPIINAVRPMAGSSTRNPLEPIWAMYGETGSLRSGIDKTAMILKVNGAQVSPQSTSNFYVDYAPLVHYPEGLNNLSLTVFDNAGNSITKNWTFTLDSTPPTLNVVSPLSQLYLTSSLPLTINTGTETVSKLSIKVNGGTESTLCTNCLSYNKSRTFSEGVNKIQVRAYDKLGNMNETNRTFTIDSKAPVISSQKPTGSVRKALSPTTFTVVYTEANLNATRGVTLNYRSNTTGKFITYVLPSCLSGTYASCFTTLNLTRNSSGAFQYYFNLTDIAGRTTKGATQTITLI